MEHYVPLSDSQEQLKLTVVVQRKSEHYDQ